MPLYLENGIILTFVLCNVAIELDVKDVVDATIVRIDKLDIMFSNAGLLGKTNSSILDIDYPIIKRVLFDVNVVGGF